MVRCWVKVKVNRWIT